MLPFGSSVVVVTTSISTFFNSSFTASRGNLSGYAIAISKTSNPNSLAFLIIHRSFSSKTSAHMNESTPNLNIRFLLI